jgi:hypothetical protein
MIVQLKLEILSDNHFNVFASKIQKIKYKTYSRKIVQNKVGRNLKKY